MKTSFWKNCYSTWKKKRKFDIFACNMPSMFAVAFYSITVFNMFCHQIYNVNKNRISSFQECKVYQIFWVKYTANNSRSWVKFTKLILNVSHSFARHVCFFFVCVLCQWCVCLLCLCCVCSVCVVSKNYKRHTPIHADIDAHMDEINMAEKIGLA